MGRYTDVYFGGRSGSDSARDFSHLCRARLRGSGCGVCAWRTRALLHLTNAKEYDCTILVWYVPPAIDGLRVAVSGSGAHPEFARNTQCLPWNSPGRLPASDSRTSDSGHACHRVRPAVSAALAILLRAVPCLPACHGLLPCLWGTDFRSTIDRSTICAGVGRPGAHP